MKYTNQLLLLSLIIYSTVSTEMITITNENQYNQAILKSDKPVVVEFSADWCSVCKGIEKPLQEVAQEEEFSHVNFARVNIDQLENISRENGIVGVPTFMYLDHGQKVNEEVGVQNMTAFKDHLRTNIRNSFKVAQTKKSAPLQPAVMVPKKAPKPEEEIKPELPTPAEEKQIPAPEKEQNWFMQLVCYIQTLILTIITKIQELFNAIVDTVKGWFGR